MMYLVFGEEFDDISIEHVFVIGVVVRGKKQASNQWSGAILVDIGVENSLQNIT